MQLASQCTRTVAFLLLIALCSSAATATFIRDNKWGDVFQGYIGTPFALDNASAKVAFGFIPTSNLTIAQIWTRATTTKNGPTYRAGIQGDLNGAPNGTWMSNSTNYILVTGANWKGGALPLQVNATGGAPYWLVIEYSSGTISPGNNYNRYDYQTALPGFYSQLLPLDLSNISQAYAQSVDNGTTWVTQPNAFGAYLLNVTQSSLFYGNPYIGMQNNNIYNATIIGEYFTADSNITIANVTVMAPSASGSGPVNLELHIINTWSVTSSWRSSSLANCNVTSSQAVNVTSCTLNNSINLVVGRNYTLIFYAPTGTAVAYAGAASMGVSSTGSPFNTSLSTFGGSNPSAFTSADNGTTITNRTDWDIGFYFNFTYTDCAYAGSGSWVIDGSHNCTLGTNTDLLTNNITFANSGTVTITANITNFTRTSASGGCRVTARSGGRLKR